MSSSSTHSALENWVSSFCSQIGHEFFAEVSEEFLEDDFNLTGLPSQVPFYKEALELILDVEPIDESDSALDLDDLSEGEGEDENNRSNRPPVAWHGSRLQEQSAELLYGLIHQRYITSRAGISQMHEKYSAGHFGHCPRVFCNGARVLPVGLSDTPDTETVKLFCPSCLDVYTPPNSRFQNVDGAFFGTTFGCLFLMTFPEIPVAGPLSNAVSPPAQDRESEGASGAGSASGAAQPAEINGVASTNFAPGLGSGHIYEPKIYGFRISERAKTGPRMKWLRMKPANLAELDEASRYEMLEEMEEQGPADDEQELEDGMDGEEITEDMVNGNPVQHRKKAPLKRRSKRADDPSQPGAIEAEG